MRVPFPKAISRGLYGAGVVLLASACFASTVTYMRLDPPVVARRLKVTPTDSRHAIDRLRAQFYSIGIDPRNIREERVPGEAVPNLIASIPGDAPGTIVIAAPSAIARESGRASVQWATLESLVLVAESMLSVATRHTLVFVAYSAPEDNVRGLETYIGSLDAKERDQIVALVSLRDLGGNPPMTYFTGANLWLRDQLHRSAKELQLKPPVFGVPDGRVFPEKASEIELPAICIFGGGQVYVDRQWRSNTRKKVNPELYYTSYQLLCVFIIDLDRRGSAGFPPPEPVATPTALEPLTPDRAESQEARAFATVASQSGLTSLRNEPKPDLRKAACEIAESKLINNSQDPWERPELEQIRRGLLSENRTLYVFLDLTAHPGDFVSKAPLDEIRRISEIALQKSLVPYSYSVGACEVPGDEDPPRWWIVTIVSGARPKDAERAPAPTPNAGDRSGPFSN